MNMLTEIIVHTPRWVFVLFAVLVWLGLQQIVTREVTLRRVSLFPIAMTGLSFYGVVSAFASQPLAVLTWLGAAAVVAIGVSTMKLPASVRYDAARQRFHLPGSFVPLALMMGIFFTKYAAGASLAISPALAQHTGFALALSALYGVFSGLFTGRAARLWKLAARTSSAAPAPAPAMSA